MKYGLPRDEKPQKEWKTALENEIKYLKMEVCYLRVQLDDAVTKLTQLSANKQPNPFMFMQEIGRLCNPFDQFSQSDNNQCNSTSSDEQPSCPVSSHQGPTNDSQGCSQRNSFTPFGGSGKGSRAVDYRPTKVTQFGKEYGSRIVCIVAMQEYESKSLEEIRFEDYNDTTWNRHEYFMICDAEGRRYQVTWDYDSSTGNPMKFHSITCMPQYSDKSFEELRHGDYVSKGIGLSNQIQRFKESDLWSSITDKKTIFSWTPTKQQNWNPFERDHSEISAANGKSHFCIPWYRTPVCAPWPIASTSGTKTTSSSAVPSTSGTCNASNQLVESAKCISPLASLGNAEANGNYSDVNNPTNDESLSSQILSEVKKMGDQLSAIDDQLSKMDSNISDISSRVSVMDSRLSAVDMFITMQRFDKKWQGLETRLTNLETSPPATDTTLPLQQITTTDVRSAEKKTTNTTPPVQQSVTTDIRPTLKKTPPPAGGIKGKITLDYSGKTPMLLISPIGGKTPPSSMGGRIPSPIGGKSPPPSIGGRTPSPVGGKTPSSTPGCGTPPLPVGSKTPPSCVVKEMKGQLGCFCVSSALAESMDISETNLADFVKSISIDTPLESKMLYSFSKSHDCMVLNSPPKAKSEDPSFEMTDLKPSNSYLSKPDLVEHPHSQEKKSIMNNSGFVYLISSEDDDCDEQTKESVSDETGESTDILTDNEELQLEQQITSLNKGNTGMFLNEVENNACTVEQEKECECNAENEFVIIGKSDVEEISEGNSKSQKETPSNEASASKDVNLCNDITEYLEINLGKKKNLVYEFGFEAKPEYLPESGEPLVKEYKSNDSPESAGATSSADDSFQKFMYNFTENENVDVKQSSPFIFTFSKPPEKSPGKPLSDKKQ